MRFKTVRLTTIRNGSKQAISTSSGLRAITNGVKGSYPVGSISYKSVKTSPYKTCFKAWINSRFGLL